jgi:hypothetical protein
LKNVLTFIRKITASWFATSSERSVLEKDSWGKQTWCDFDNNDENSVAPRRVRM